MDTLAYLHFAITYEASTNSELGTVADDHLFFQELDWTKCRSAAWIPLFFFAIALFTLSLASPTLALEKGNKGSQVTSLQKKLQAAGYFNGPVTGYYGSLTQEAVSQFQKAKGLTADGIADEVTLNTLEFSPGEPVLSQPATSQTVVTDQPKTLPSPTQTLEKGTRSSQVTSLQKKLQAAGYFNGSVTGYYGSLTQEAVRQFQKANGIVADGVADKMTLKALESSLGTPAPTQLATPQPLVVDQPKKLANPTQTLERGARSSQVTSLQRKLQAAGYFNGPVTGYYGSLTQEAVRQFQKANGIVADGVADKMTLKVLESSSGTPTPSSGFTDESKEENRGNLDTPKKTSPTVEKPSPEKSSSTQNKPQVEKTPQEDSSSVENLPQEKSPPVQSEMKLKKTISGKISPKSVVHSGTGLFFAQNMMYSHTITVYDRNHNLVKTIPDGVNLPKYGYSNFKGNYKGAPVEAAFSDDGKYAWVSNYQMYGSGFNNPGSDECTPSQKTDKSFLYRINTESLNIEKVIQVGSVPKFVATSPDNHLVLVSNWCSWDLSIVDTEKNQEIKRIQLGRYPRGIVVDGDSEKAYVAVMGSYDIATVDLNNFSVGWLRNIGQSPRHLNIDPVGKYLYATLNGEGTVAKIDLSTDKVLKKVVSGNEPRSMVLSDDGQRLYVVNYGSNTVSKIRTSDMKVLQTVNVNDAPIGITYDPQTREVWVACYSGSIMIFQD
jgi:YVTN family beta-propeller protein